jgi:hypothetical protein
MTKKDLRTGMVVTFRSGDKALVVTEYNEGVFVYLDACKSFMPFRKYNDDLTLQRNMFFSSSDKEFDVMSVEEISREVDIKRIFTKTSDVKLKHIWAREPKEFKVMCVDNGDGIEFTVGKIYTWKDNTFKNDRGFTYSNIAVNGDDPNKWMLSHYYKFIKVVE